MRQLIPNLKIYFRQQKLQVLNMTRQRAKSRQVLSANSGCDSGTSRQ
jgi:hypothetical protein